MKHVRLKEKSKALVIVAHPDDETIWMGGTILKYKKIDWTIFSLCRSSDKDRAPKFRKVCKRYQARSIITDLDDEDKLSLEHTIPVIKKLISKYVGKNRYDYVFTHGSNGEYGHPRHIGAYLAIKDLVKKNKLNSELLFHFHYKTKKKHKLIVKKNSDLMTRLSATEFTKKTRIMIDIYGFDKDGIDVGLCTNPEAFIAKTINK